MESYRASIENGMVQGQNKAVVKLKMLSKWVRKDYCYTINAAFRIINLVFFIKKSDYSISFTAKASTGTVYQGIQDWASARLISDSKTIGWLIRNNLFFKTWNEFKMISWNIFGISIIQMTQ
jgi:hypothetical protein